MGFQLVPSIKHTGFRHRGPQMKTALTVATAKSKRGVKGSLALLKRRSLKSKLGKAHKLPFLWPFVRVVIGGEGMIHYSVPLSLFMQWQNRIISEVCVVRHK